MEVKKLDEMLEKALELNEEHKRIKEEASKVWAKYETLYMEIINHLIDLDRDSYKSPNVQFNFVEKQTAKVPKDDENRKLFFDYLKSRGAYERMIGVNSATLNSFYKQERELEAHKGNFDFKMPGIIEGEPYFQAKIKRIK